MSVYLSLARSRRKKKTISAVTTALSYPLLSHWAVETSPYVGTHGPPWRLSQILRRPQALLLLFQLLWIPLARQLIGGNNKLGSLQPLTNMSPSQERPSHVHMCRWTYPHLCAHTHAHMQSSAGRWGDSGTDISVISLSVVPSHCHHLSVFNSWNRGKCVKSILHSLKEQPATTVWHQRWPLVLLLGPQWKRLHLLAYFQPQHPIVSTHQRTAHKIQICLPDCFRCEQWLWFLDFRTTLAFWEVSALKYWKQCCHSFDC